MMTHILGSDIWSLVWSYAMYVSDRHLFDLKKLGQGHQSFNSSEIFIRLK